MLRVKKNRFRRRRKGVTVVEVVILMVVLAISIWAIMSTAIWATDLQSFNRQYIGANILVSSWFEAAESIPPDDFESDFDAAAELVLKRLGGSGGYLEGFSITPVDVSSGDGARTVRLTLTTQGKNAPYVITRSLNLMSVETVSDDRVYVREE